MFLKPFVFNGPADTSNGIGFHGNISRNPQSCQLTEPAQLQSRFGGTKISVVSGSGEEPKEIYVPEMQQMIDGDCGEQGAIVKYYRMVQFTVRQQLQSKRRNSMYPLGKSRHSN